jgi:hypothetical protein
MATTHLPLTKVIPHLPLPPPQLCRSNPRCILALLEKWFTLISVSRFL